MALYATASELASYLQKDLDTASATQALTLASGDFSRAAGRRWVATAVTWTTRGTTATGIEIPYRPATAVSQVRINGVTVTGWELRHNTLWRAAGFGDPYAFPPDELAVDLTYGETIAPDDVKLSTLEIAAGIYEHPVTSVASESIDDYMVKYNGIPISPGRPWREVAADYRGPVFA